MMRGGRESNTRTRRAYGRAVGDFFCWCETRRIHSATGNHTFRATGITAYLDNGGTLERTQQIAAHESPRTTKLYDRTSDQITLDDIERIAI